MDGISLTEQATSLKENEATHSTLCKKKLIDLQIMTNEEEKLSLEDTIKDISTMDTGNLEDSNKDFSSSEGSSDSKRKDLRLV